MLKVNILRVCDIRSVKKPFSYFKNHGFSTASATRIAGGRMNSFSLETVEKLCLLFNCTPNDLLEWVPPKDMVANTAHSLNALKRNNDSLATFTQLVNGASLDKLEKIHEIIQRELGG